MTAHWEKSRTRGALPPGVDSSRIGTGIAMRLGAPALFFALLLVGSSLGDAHCQCSGIATTPSAAARCAGRYDPLDREATLDPAHVYSLAELIDVAERSNPQTHLAWEEAKQAAERLGVARSAYFPVLSGLAAAGDQRTIEPFTKPLAPKGYVMVEAPAIVPKLRLDYLIFDFGRRGASVDAANAATLAEGATFIRVNQEVAFRVATAYYNLLTAQARLTAAEQTLKTAQTTQDAAEAQLENGRATLPDVLNAKAETAQARFDLESATGDEQVARVALTETVGAEPSPDIRIDDQAKTPLPEAFTQSIDELIHRAIEERPDLMAKQAEIQEADEHVRAAKSEYLPTICLSASGAQTSLWPTTDYGTLAPVSEPTWSAQIGIKWRLFDGGARKQELAAARSESREGRDALRGETDDAIREVWAGYIGFRTALRQHQAAQELLEAAGSSWSSSLDAYKYGVENLVDVLSAERQLARARLSAVSARSQLFEQAVDLEFVTGNLLRMQESATRAEGANP